jgi:hypothetical protein
MLYPVPRLDRDDLTISLAVLTITAILVAATFILR